MAARFRYPDSAYSRKIGRAEQHLTTVKAAVRRYRNGSPYVAVRDRETNPNPRVWQYRAELAHQPSPRLPLLIGDFVHNLRASLDHLQAALVPANRNRSTKFQIHREDIWEICEETGAYVEKFADRRQSWDSAMKGIHPEAKTLIYALQPFIMPFAPEYHPVAILNTLDDADKHYKLLPVNTGIAQPMVVLTNGDLRLTHTAPDTLLSGAIVAEFEIRPANVATMTNDKAMRERILRTMADGTANMHVQLTGEPQIALKVGKPGKQLPLPDGLDSCLHSVRAIVRELEPYVLPHGQSV